MEGDGLRAEGEFLVFICLLLKAAGEPRVRNCVGFLM